MSGKKWTGKEIQYVKRYVILDETNRPLNIPEMAKKLGRSEKSVAVKLIRLRDSGILPTIDRSKSFEMENLPFSATDDQRIIHMLKRMFTHQEIAEMLGRSRASITNRIYILRKYGKLDGLGNKKWCKREVELLLKSIKFDVNGFVSNYDELEIILKTRKRMIKYKVEKLRREGVIEVNPIPNTSSINRINFMRRHNAWDFQRNATQQLDPYEKDGTTVIQVLVKPVEKDGEQLMEYRTQSGDLLVTKKPTSVAPEVSNKKEYI